MEIVVTIEDQKYEHRLPVDFPDTEQMMSAMECIINKLEYPIKEVEDYILDWAKEIKDNRNGKN